MALPRPVSRSEPDEHYCTPWNAMVDLCAMEPIEKCTPIQRKAALVFWYQAEVNNGGHFQYFVNSAGVHRSEALEALRELGALTAADILDQAIALINDTKPKLPDSPLEYIEQEAESGLEELDSRYYESADTEVHAALLRFLEANELEFVAWIP